MYTRGSQPITFRYLSLWSPLSLWNQYTYPRVRIKNNSNSIWPHKKVLAVHRVHAFFTHITKYDWSGHQQYIKNNTKAVKYVQLENILLIFYIITSKFQPLWFSLWASELMYSYFSKLALWRPFSVTLVVQVLHMGWQYFHKEIISMFHLKHCGSDGVKLGTLYPTSSFYRWMWHCIIDWVIEEMDHFGSLSDLQRVHKVKRELAI